MLASQCFGSQIEPVRSARRQILHKDVGSFEKAHKHQLRFGPF
jgi:hypothetical protein